MVPQVGALHRRAEPEPLAVRRTGGQRAPAQAPARRRIRRGLRRARHAQGGGLLRRRRRRRLHHAHHPARRPAIEHRARVPRTRAAAAESPGGHRRHGRPGDRRGRPRHRGALRPRRAGRDGERAARGDRQRGGAQFSRGADALGHRPRRAARRARHRGAARRARGRQQPAGTRELSHDLRGRHPYVEPADDPVRDGARVHQVPRARGAA